MKSERILSNEVAKEAAEGIVVDTLNAARQQRRKELKNALCILGGITVIVIFALFLDSVEWKMDAFVFTGAGVVFPLVCAIGFLVLLGNGIYRKLTGKTYGRTFAIALALLLLLLIFAGLFFLIGVLGAGPVPN